MANFNGKRDGCNDKFFCSKWIEKGRNDEWIRYI